MPATVNKFIASGQLDGTPRPAQKSIKMDIPEHYTYSVLYSPEDAAHVGLCAEFSSLSWLASTPAAALSGIKKLVRIAVADMRANNEPIPAAPAEKN